ncbi:MAG: exodeoxyribonuclease VII small subunit [Spirochaetia bacterium]|jgi:exodeoxyribonuclease VII small subunit|nr:exodeoxyribonuclease VII small subunit [Spirochaetia bacterium]
MTFEKDLERMEKIATALRSDNTSLEDSLKLFEEGMKLSHDLEKRLEEAKRKVKLIMQDNEGGIEEKDMKSDKEGDNEFAFQGKEK